MQRHGGNAAEILPYKADAPVKNEGARAVKGHCFQRAAAFGEYRVFTAKTGQKSDIVFTLFG